VRNAEGKVFNINADTIASAIAVQLQAEKLVLLSDVDGIFLRTGEPETKLSRLTAGEAKALIDDGSATGGMIPKLQNIVDILDSRREERSHHQRQFTQLAARRSLHQ
jgi:acetylglutamate kinase